MRPKKALGNTNVSMGIVQIPETYEELITLINNRLNELTLRLNNLQVDFEGLNQQYSRNMNGTLLSTNTTLVGRTCYGQTPTK